LNDAGTLGAGGALATLGAGGGSGAATARSGAAGGGGGAAGSSSTGGGTGFRVTTGGSGRGRETTGGGVGIMGGISAGSRSSHTTRAEGCAHTSREPAATTRAPSPRWIASEHASGRATRVSKFVVGSSLGEIVDDISLKRPVPAGTALATCELRALRHTDSGRRI
jgi:hypothetical protein